MDAKAFIYANVPRLLWITDLKVLGGYIGVDALVPLRVHRRGYQGWAAFDDSSTFGIGDSFLETTWSSHLKQFDFALGYRRFGRRRATSSASNPTWAGLGYWTHMFTAGATWYIGYGEEVVAFGPQPLRNQHGAGGHGADPRARPIRSKGASSYGVTKTIDVGAVGYYQQQVNRTQWRSPGRAATA